MEYDKFLEEYCIVCDNIFQLSEIEQLGLDGFCEKVRIPPIKSLFKYFPNTRKWDRKEKKYRNFSYEALTNNTVFLQDAENFDDCFDCAIDLDPSKFLNTRLLKYCDYFDVKYTEESKTDDLLYLLSVKLYEYNNSLQKVLAEIEKFSDSTQKLSVELFIKRVMLGVHTGTVWQHSIINAINEEYREFVDSFKKFKISCFSSSPFLNRMWSSAYANNNKGFCLEYEIDLSNPDLLELYSNIYPVIYSHRRIDTLPISSDCDKTLSKEFLWQMFFNGLLRKSLFWVDQKEWRLILPESMIKSNPLQFFKIKKVYLGNKMSRQDRLKIIDYCHLHNIEYVGIVRDNNSFDLKECAGDCCSCKK